MADKWRLNPLNMAGQRIVPFFCDEYVVNNLKRFSGAKNKKE
jgi:hypothetical protein